MCSSSNSILSSKNKVEGEVVSRPKSARVTCQSKQKSALERAQRPESYVDMMTFSSTSFNFMLISLD